MPVKQHPSVTGPAYLDQRFAQSLPKSPDDLELLTPETASHSSLLYRDRETGVEYLVPNVWYTQPRATRIKTAQFHVAQAEQSLREAEALWKRTKTVLHRIGVTDAENRVRRCREALQALQGETVR